MVVSFAAVFELVTSRNPPPHKESSRLWGGGLRDVTSLKTAAKETKRMATLFVPEKPNGNPSF